MSHSFERGFEELAPHATVMDLDGLEVAVASLHDIIRSKQTADRDKDRAALPALLALQDEIADLERDER